ncbi:MAG TPA: phosphorylase [Bacteroidales bacterium]|nr:phosphorylase [Bacteroidales bacterium]
MENKLAASELTLAKDGSLYHIHLKPHQLYDNIILVGDPQRVEMVSNHFDSIDFKTSNREIFVCSGKFNGVGVTVLSTGMGVDNIDIVLTELDACANINLQTREFNNEQRQLNVVRLGTCGSLQKDVPCGEFVVSRYVVGIDGIMYFYKNKEGVIDENLTQSFISFMNWDNSLPKPYGVGCSEKLLDKLAFDMKKGITITSPGFYGPQGRQIRLPLAFSDINEKLSAFSFNEFKATNYEMETSALYCLGKNLEHNCLTVCLVIANRMEGRFLESYHNEMNNLIKLILKRICS